MTLKQDRSVSSINLKCSSGHFSLFIPPIRKPVLVILFRGYRTRKLPETG